MSTDSSNSPILVTGAASGIGSTIASRLSGLGFPVLATVRTQSQADEIDQTSEGSVQAVAWDIEAADALPAASTWIRDTVGDGGLRAVICCAGRGQVGPVETMDLQELRSLFEVNVIGQVGLIQQCLPLLRRSVPPGRVILIGSISARIALPFSGAYGASKHAAAALIESLRHEVSPWNIPVVDIVPGRVATPLWEKTEAQGQRLLSGLSSELRALYEPALRARLSRVDQTKMLSPNAVADAVVEAVTDDHPRRQYIVGKDAKLLSLIAACPLSLRTRLIRRLLPSKQD